MWIGYIAIAGRLSRADIAGYLDGTRAISDADHDVLALVVNEELADRGGDYRVDYYRPPNGGDLTPGD